MNPMENEELIQQQMAETRASLAEKLETLEQKVVGTVEGATTAVNETVDVIKDSVQETVATVNDTVKESVETVKDWFDVEAHVRERPWLMMGGSVAVGYCLGAMLGSAQQAAPYAASPTYPWMNQPSSGGTHAHNGGSREARPATESQTSTAQSVVQSAFSNWAPEIAKLKALALGVVLGTAREMITSSLSGHVADQLKDVFDSVTKKVGGEPIPGSDLAQMRPDTHEGRQEERTESGSHWQGEKTYGAAEATGRRW